MKHLAPKDVFLCHMLRQLTQAFSITWMKHLSSVYIYLYSHTQKWLHRWPEYFCHRKECPLSKSINYLSDSSWSPQLLEFNCHESATMSSNLGQVHSEKIQFLSPQSEASILTKPFLPQCSLVLGSRAGYHRICLNAMMITLNWSSMKNSWWEKIFLKTSDPPLSPFSGKWFSPWNFPPCTRRIESSLVKRVGEFEAKKPV